MEAVKRPLSEFDPMTVAREFLQAHCSHQDTLTLRHHADEFKLWDGAAYRTLGKAEVQAMLIRHCDGFASKLTRPGIGNIIACVAAECGTPSRLSMPAWLGDAPHGYADATSILAAPNGLFRLTDLADGGATPHPPTPQFFSANVLDYHVNPEAGEPVEWLEFLRQIWPDDPDCIDTLQEWFGYSLTPDTRQQKILLIVGPKRSGKGTIGRVLRALVGHENVAGPTLAGLGTQFGLWPLIGKSLAIIADARLSGRTDAAAVTERLLAISGEDAQTVDRKCIPPVTTKLSTRFVILTNELPRLGDSSGALAGRMIVLPLTQSFYGREDHGLTDRLLTELPGILRWAVAGWKRLRDQGRIVQPGAGAEAVAELEDLASPISVFIREWCALGPEHQTAVSELYTKWCAWCEHVGRRDCGTEQTFGRDLRAAVPGLKSIRPRDGESRFRAYRGIRLRGDC